MANKDEVQKSREKWLINEHNLETVVILNNKNPRPKSYVEIGIDAEEYYRIKNN